MTRYVPGDSGAGMTKGLEIRPQIGTEQMKGLLPIDGGAAVALLAFCPQSRVSDLIGELRVEPHSEPDRACW